MCTRIINLPDSRILEVFIHKHLHFLDRSQTPQKHEKVVRQKPLFPSNPCRVLIYKAVYYFLWRQGPCVCQSKKREMLSVDLALKTCVTPWHHLESPAWNGKGLTHQGRTGKFLLLQIEAHTECGENRRWENGNSFSWIQSQLYVQ